jgi:hypothetical protein
VESYIGNVSIIRNSTNPHLQYTRRDKSGKVIAPPQKEVEKPLEDSNEETKKLLQEVKILFKTP